MELLVLILFGIVFLLLRFRFPSRSGESAVSSKISSLIKKNPEYGLVDNLILKTPDGSTQIDHVLISPYGIFVIETKDLGGWIFGGEHQKKWTQSFRSGWFHKNAFQFQNPIYQNYKHVKAVQNFLKIDSKSLFNVVVFAGNSRFMTEMPHNVRELHDFIPYIKSYREKIINDERVKEIGKIFIDYINNSPITHDDHMENLERNRMHPTCPKCGILMVLRTARKGQRAGSQFWGCSNYPSCKTTKSIVF
jgi:restriction system protein